MQPLALCGVSHADELIKHSNSFTVASYAGSVQICDHVPSCAVFFFLFVYCVAKGLYYVLFVWSRAMPRTCTNQEIALQLKIVSATERGKTSS